MSLPPLLVVMLACAPPLPCGEVACRDVDGDGFAHAIDCDDTDSAVFPGANDPAGDGIDQDCSGTDAAVVSQLAFVADATWSGPLAYALAGAALATADVDGDGVDELVVTGLAQECAFEATGIADCGSEGRLGAVHVLHWQSGAFDAVSVLVPDESMPIGRPTTASDVDGDGDDDLLVGDDPTRSLVFGPDFSEIGSIRPGTADLVGDDDGDGMGSVWLTSSTGRVLLYRQPLDLVSDESMNAASADVHVTPLPPLLADADGDGRDEWVVSVRRETLASILLLPPGLEGDLDLSEVGTFWPLDPGVTVESLAVAPGGGVVVGGRPGADGGDGRVSVLEASTAPDGGAAVDIGPDLDLDRLGQSVAILDVNGDGMDDLLVGAPGRDDLDLPRPGKVHVFLGPLGGDPAAHEAEDTLIGEAWGDRAGAALAVGDFDGSGQPDVAIGAPGATTAAGPHAGRVYVWFDPVL